MGQWWVMGQSSRWLVGGHRKKTQPVGRHNSAEILAQHLILFCASVSVIDMMKSSV